MWTPWTLNGHFKSKLVSACIPVFTILSAKMDTKTPIFRKKFLENILHSKKFQNTGVQGVLPLNN